MYDTLKERFLKYVKIETRSNDESETIPTTQTQVEFAKMLKAELEEIGLENVFINDACFVNGTLPSNTDKKVPVIGFIAHMDTADFNAVNINPQIIENYDGKDIVLNKDLGITMHVDEFPNLKNYVGKTLEYESFNAAEAIFTIKGKSVHPGTAKGKMVNANTIAVELASLFPADEVPEKTEGYEGFYLLEGMKTTIEDAEMEYILRDHDKEKFLAKKKFAEDVAKKINEKYGEGTVKVSLKDQYYNMGEVIKNHMNVVEIAKEAMENLGIKPIIKAIRGGTDGSKISFMGLPTPNIFAGGENFHGKYEFVALESMVQATDTIIEIIKLNEKKG